MDLAQKALEGAKFERALQLLDKHTPTDPATRDVRGLARRMDS